MAHSLLTIVLPTRNRPSLLRRSLTFYARYGLSYPIAIADSSDPEYHAEMDSLLEEFPQISIEITRFSPDYNSWLKIIEVMEAQTTPYIGLSGDDDVLLDEALTSCVLFLQANPDVSVVDGQEIRIARPSPLLETYWGYSAVLHEQNNVISADPVKRLVQYFQSYWPTFYGVHQRESVVEAFRTAYSMETENLVSELMQGAITVLNGTYRCLSVPYIIRQVYHNQSTAFDSWDKIVQSAEFSSQVAYFRKRVGEKFPDDDRIPAACDLAFDRFLESMLPEYDFKASGVAVNGGAPARKLASETDFGDPEVRECAKILTPPELRLLAAQTNKAALVSAAHMVVSCPDGIPPKGVVQDGDLEEILTILPPSLTAVVGQLCLDGFGPILSELLVYAESRSGCLTYQSIALKTGHNFVTLPVMAECILACGMAQMHNAVPDCLRFIETLAAPDLDMAALLAYVSKDGDANDVLDQVRHLLTLGPSSVISFVESLPSASFRSLDIERAVLLGVFAACCTQEGVPALASSAYAAHIAGGVSCSAQTLVNLLADMARISFAALQSHLLIQAEWNIDPSDLALSSPEGLFWVAEYGGAFNALGYAERATEILENGVRISEQLKQKNSGLELAVESATAQFLFHLARLRLALHDPRAEDTIKQAVEKLTAVHGSGSWMIVALRENLPT